MTNFDGRFWPKKIFFSIFLTLIQKFQPLRRFLMDKTKKNIISVIAIIAVTDLHFWSFFDTLVVDLTTKMTTHETLVVIFLTSLSSSTRWQYSIFWIPDFVNFVTVNFFWANINFISRLIRNFKPLFVNFKPILNY